MQRSNSVQWASSVAFTVCVLLAITLMCGGFLLTGTEIPSWFHFVGRFVPVIIVLGVLKAFGHRNWAFWLRLGSTWRRALAGSSIAVATLLLVYALAALVAITFGIGSPQTLSFYGNAALIVIPSTIVFSLSTLGEEAAWRGFLQQCWSPLGFWRSSAAIATLWAIFHIPLHAAFVAQKTLPVEVAVTSTVTLIPLGLFLSAVSVRFGSVWPAVFAHALPLSALNLIMFKADPQPTDLWIITGISSALLAAAAYLFAPKNKGEHVNQPALSQVTG